MTLELAFSEPLRGLVHELYFKSPHYRPNPRITKQEHQKHDDRFSRPGWLSLIGGDDPIRFLLNEIHSSQFGVDSQRDNSSDLESWERAESTINARLRAICQLLGPGSTAEAIQTIASVWQPLSPLTVTSIKKYLQGKRVDRIFGQPDILLHGKGIFMSIEMKVRGGDARAKYTVDQHFKYLRLAQRVRQKSEMQMRTLHVLAAPLGGGRIINGEGVWLKQSPDNGKLLEIDTEEFINRLSRSRREEAQDFENARIQEFIDLMPCLFVDLQSLLLQLKLHPPLHQEWRGELDRQIERCNYFAYPNHV